MADPGEATQVGSLSERPPGISGSDVTERGWATARTVCSIGQFHPGSASALFVSASATRTSNTPTSAAMPSGPPGAMSIWQAQAQGTGTQAVTWRVDGGDWSVVVMNADGSRGIAFRADAGATVPWLLWVGVGALVLAVLLAAASLALIMLPVKRVGQELREPSPLDVPN
jgi:hypothetical protein